MKRLLDSIALRMIAIAMVIMACVIPWAVPLVGTATGWFVGIGLALSTLAFSIYLIEMWRKRGRGPHPVAWVSWAVIGYAGTAVAFLNHAGWATLIPLYYALFTSVIAGFSLTKAYGKHDAVEAGDWITAAVAVPLVIVFQAAGLIWDAGWLVILAAAGTVIADAKVSWIQVRVSAQEPKSEPTWAWFLSALGSVVGGVWTLNSHAFAAVAYPMYLALMISLVAIIQLFLDRPETRKARSRVRTV